MGKQQNGNINSARQSVYNDLGLEKAGITYDQFSQKFDENEDFRRSVYNDLGFESQNVDYDKFYTIMGKPQEVSAQGSEVTSQTSVEPIQPTEETPVLQENLPDQPSEVLSEPSSEVVSIPEGFRDAGGGRLIPTVNRTGTWREPLEGDFTYDVQGYEIYTPTPKAVADAGGWDNMVKYFREQQPNVLLAPPFDPNNPESNESVGELSGQFINEDVAKPVNLESLAKQRQLESKPFDQWDQNDQVDFFVNRITQQNIAAGTAPVDENAVVNNEVMAQGRARKEEDKGVFGNIADEIGLQLRNIGRESTRLGLNVLNIPEFMYDALSNITGEPTFQETYGGKLLQGFQDYANGAITRDELYNSERFSTDGAIESFEKGNIANGVRSLASVTTSSLPIMVALTSGNAMAAGSTLSMGAGQYSNLQQNNPDMDLASKMMNSTLTMYAEMIPEKIGADAVFKPFYELYKKSGKEVAQGALSSFMRQVGSKFGVMTPSATEFATEATTQVLNNVIAKYSGEDPNRKINQDVLEAAVGGGFSGGAIASPAQIANSVANKKVRKNIESKYQENLDIETSLSDPELPEDIRRPLVERYEANTAEINDYIEQQEADKGKLSPEQKRMVEVLESSRERVNQLAGNESVPESVRENAQQEVEEINNQIEEIIESTPEAQENETEQEVQPVATEESVEVPMESTEVQPTGETSGQAQELVEQRPAQNEEVVQGVVAPVAETGKQDQNVDVEPNEVATRKQKQLDVINNSNPAPNSNNTWIRSVDDILSGEEAMNQGLEDGAMYPDFSESSIQESLKSGEVMVYSSYPIENGVFVTPSKMEAINYAGGDSSKVYSKKVNINDVAWIDQGEGQYAPISSQKNVNESQENTVQENEQTPVREEVVGVREPRSSFANVDEYERHVAETSNDPDEIATEYARSVPQEADYVEQQIMDYIGSGKINESDFNTYGDPNWADGKTKDRWIDSKNSQGLSLDQMAQELSDNLGFEVTPQEFIDVITAYGGVRDFNAQKKTEGQLALEQKYYELTGKKLTRSVAQKAYDRTQRQLANLTDEQRASVDEGLQELGITYQDILDYEEFNREIAESGPGGLQQQPIQSGVPEVGTEGTGAQTEQVEQQNQVDEKSKSTVQKNERQKVQPKEKQEATKTPKNAKQKKSSAIVREVSDRLGVDAVKKPTNLLGSRSEGVFGDAWNKFSDAIRSALNNVKNFNESIEEGVKAMKASYWYRNLPSDSKKQAVADFRQSMYNAYDTVEQDLFPSAKNARTARIREKYGLGDRIVPEVEHATDVIQEARNAVSSGDVHPADILAKANSGRPLTAMDQVVLVDYMNQLENVVMESDAIIENPSTGQAAYDQAVNNRENALNQMSASAFALEKTGTLLGRALAARRWAIDRDISLPSMITMARKAKGNVALTQAELDKITKQFNEINRSRERLEKRVGEITEELSEARATIALMAEAKQAELEARRKKDKSGSRGEAISDIQARREEAKQALKDSIKSILESKNHFAAIPEFEAKRQFKEDANFAKALGQLVKTYLDEALLRAGKVNYNSVINNITRDLQELHPNLTKKQVTQLIDMLDVDDRSTLQQIRADIADLKQQARESNLANEKKSIQGRIEKLQERIKAQDFKPVPQKLEQFDAEYRKLKKELDNKIYDFRLAVEKDKLSRRGLLAKAIYGISEVFSLPRALMATGDLSAPLRQGIVAMIGNPKIGLDAFKEMHKMAFSPSYYENYMESIREQEHFELAMKSGLSVTGAGPNVWATLREEQWSSKLISKVPGVGHIASFSERAFAGFLNKIRVDLFNHYAETLLNDGKNPQDHADQFKLIATYVNAITGRGPAPARWEGMFGDLSVALFAPRLITSRLYLLFGGPLWQGLKTGNTAITTAYLKDMTAFVATNLAVMGLMSMIDGVELMGDDEDEKVFGEGAADTWTSKDFGNIKYGDRRYDIWGGFKQYVSLFSSLGFGQTTSTYGNVRYAEDEEYKQLSYLARFSRSKLSPSAALLIDWTLGEDYMGNDFEWSAEQLYNMGVPLVYQETLNSMFGWFGSEKEGASTLASVFLPSTYGVGVQTWDSKSVLKKGVDDDTLKAIADKQLNVSSKRRRDMKVIDPETGEDRKLTDAEYEQYKKIWDEQARNGLNEIKDRLKNMSKEKAKKEVDKIKRAATAIAKKSITGVESADLRIDFNNTTYKLTPEQLRKRLSDMDAYRSKNRNKYDKYVRLFMKQGESKVDAEISASKEMDKEARSYTRVRMLQDFQKGKIKLEEN